MRSHIFDLLEELKQRKVFGMVRMSKMFYEKDFDFIKKENKILHGVVHYQTHYLKIIGKVIKDLFIKFFTMSILKITNPEDCEFYICGPPMMNSVLSICIDEVEREDIMLDDFGG